MSRLQYDDGRKLEYMRVWAMSRVGPGRFRYIWGGMDWAVTFDYEPLELGDYLVWDGEEMRIERRVDFRESDC